MTTPPGASPGPRPSPPDPASPAEPADPAPKTTDGLPVDQPQEVPDPLIPIPAATHQVPLEVEPGPAAVPLSFPAKLLVTTFGLGLLRPASGTWGSTPPVALAAAMLALGLGPSHGSAWAAENGMSALTANLLYAGILLAIAVAFSGFCIVFGKQSEVTFKRKDPGQVVADETAAMSLVLLAIPPWAVATPIYAAATLLGCFLAFRIFDILKLPPARKLQRLGGGTGILVDDLIAAVQAWLLVQAVTRVGPILLGGTA